jgi:hypothetical protein
MRWRARAGIPQGPLGRRQWLLLAQQAADQHANRDRYHQPHETNQHNSAHGDALHLV